MKRIALFLIIISFCKYTFGQEHNNLTKRIQAIENYGVIFYNVDGYEITSQVSEGKFTQKNIRKRFKSLRIKKENLTKSDSLIDVNNYVYRTSNTENNVTQNISYYFLQTNDNEITAITFIAINRDNIFFERDFINIFLNNKIPKEAFASQTVDSINFAGRKIYLGESCKWKGVNNVQCPYYGQMNWSVHETLAEAKKTADNHLTMIKLEKKGKIVAEENINVIFEGNEVIAKRIIYDFTGVTSVLVGMSGGKTLTIYFIAGAGNIYFVSCVMSFWNNDSINPKTGLPPLLEKIITIKE